MISMNPVPRFAASFKIAEDVRPSGLRTSLEAIGRDICTDLSKLDSFRMEFDVEYAANRDSTGNSLTFSRDRSFPGVRILPGTIQEVVTVSAFYKEKAAAGAEAQPEKSLDVGGWHAYKTSGSFREEIVSSVFDALRELGRNRVQIQ